jgi:hypothetical protein
MAANASIEPRTSKSLPVPELEDYGYPVAASEPSEASGWKYLSETLKELVTASQVLQARHLLCPSLTKKRGKKLVNDSVKSLCLLSKTPV